MVKRGCVSLEPYKLVKVQLLEVTLMFCSGFEVRTRLVIGTSGLVLRQLEEVTLTFSSGFEARTHLALGIRCLYRSGEHVRSPARGRVDQREFRRT